jgi:peptidoglycan-associated lipoprotein
VSSTPTHHAAAAQLSAAQLDFRSIVGVSSGDDQGPVGHIGWTLGITVEDETRLALGQRAPTVRELLLKAGLDGSLVEIDSHGERSLLRKTPDNTPESRNRRVEITIR